ncbi:MAG: TMEM165/GDT1 family protein [Nitrososphaeria archaeon]
MQDLSILSCELTILSLFFIQSNLFVSLSSFYLVTLGKLGDKNQISTITLSAEKYWDSMLLGIRIAFASTVGVGTILGTKVVVLSS